MIGVGDMKCCLYICFIANYFICSREIYAVEHDRVVKLVVVCIHHM